MYSFLFLLLITTPKQLKAEINLSLAADTITNSEKIINTSFISGSVLTYAGLYHLWYKDYPPSKFQFFNDLDEWNYMDKVGHLYSAYHFNNFCFGLLKKNKIKNPLLKSSIYSFSYMAGIEIFDGFSKEWGFSTYDLLSNGLGTFLFAIQEKKLNGQKFKLKFSAHMTHFAKCRPSLLGKNKIERIFKDYNGQTYWLTINLNKSFNEKVKILKFIDFAFGYSINGFTGARENPILNNGSCNDFNPSSSLLLSLDLNLDSLKGKNKLLDILIQSLSLIKIPAPTFVFEKSPSFKLLYF